MKGYDDKSTKKERPEQTNVLDSAERKLKPSREKSAVFFNIVQMRGGAAIPMLKNYDVNFI